MMLKERRGEMKGAFLIMGEGGECIVRLQLLSNCIA